MRVARSGGAAPARGRRAGPGGGAGRWALLAGGSALGLAGAACGSSSREPADDGSIGAAIRAYDAAWNTRDSAAVAAVLAPDYVYFSSTGTLTTRDSTLAFLTSPDYRLDAASRTELRVVDDSRDAAVVSSRWRGRGSWRGEPFEDDQRCSLVLRRSDGRWQLLSEHCTQIASGEAPQE